MTLQSQTGELDIKGNETLKFPCQSRKKTGVLNVQHWGNGFLS